MRAWIAQIFIALISLTTPVLGDPLKYSLTAVAPTFPGSTKSRAWGINSFGQVVGESGGAIHRPFLWTPSIQNGTLGTIQSLPLPYSYSVYTGDSSAYGINDRGQVVGTIRFDGRLGSAFLWSPSEPNGKIGSTILPVLGQDTWAFGINGMGQIAGGAHSAFNNPSGAFLWTPSTPNGISGSAVYIGGFSASGINDFGQMSGNLFLWSPAIPNGSIGTFIDQSGGWGSISYATSSAINSSGKIVGTAEQRRGLVWIPTAPNDTTGTWSLFGEDYTFVEALDINNPGQVVGAFSGDFDDFHAFIWTPESGVLDLNSLLETPLTNWTLRSASGINDLGQIVGIGFYDYDGPGGNDPIEQAFLLTPVPEHSVAIPIFSLIVFIRRIRRE